MNMPPTIKLHFKSEPHEDEDDGFNPNPISDK